MVSGRESFRMSGQPRVFAEGATYHVYVWTARRERVFVQAGEA